MVIPLVGRMIMISQALPVMKSAKMTQIGILLRDPTLACHPVLRLTTPKGLA